MSSEQCRLISHNKALDHSSSYSYDQVVVKTATYSNTE